MWEVENDTPFAADRAWTRDRNGAEVWLVAVKCTFDIQQDGSCTVAEAQPSVLQLPEYHGEPGNSSVKYGADLIPTKLRTDIILTGHACAPRERAVTQLDVGFRVGPVQKILRVVGDRTWGPLAGPSSPEPFVKMPLVYERAFGGRDFRSTHPERDWEWRNPVGTGFAVSRDNLVGVPLPNIEYPQDVVNSWSDRPRPAGFGPVDTFWQPRVSFAGTYDDEWLNNRQPLPPVDFDDQFFQITPADQQSPVPLRGGEPVILLGLSPVGDIRFTLPKVFLGFETHFFDRTQEIHRERRLHTVILEPDFPRVSLVWHTALPCHHRVQKLDRTVVTVKSELTSIEPTAVASAGPGRVGVT
jgi:hypothetical protein